MSGPLTRKATDYSDKTSFAFGFFCDRCGKEWKSPEISFNQMGFTDIKEDEVRELLWEQEHRAAFAQANLEAHFHFNLCPLCGKWVCDACFRAEETRYGGVCKNCSIDRFTR